MGNYSSVSRQMFTLGYGIVDYGVRVEIVVWKGAMLAGAFPASAAAAAFAAEWGSDRSPAPSRPTRPTSIGTGHSSRPHILTNFFKTGVNLQSFSSKEYNLN